MLTTLQLTYEPRPGYVETADVIVRAYPTYGVILRAEDSVTGEHVEPQALRISAAELDRMASEAYAEQHA